MQTIGVPQKTGENTGRNRYEYNKHSGQDPAILCNAILRLKYRVYRLILAENNLDTDMPQSIQPGILIRDAVTKTQKNLPFVSQDIESLSNTHFW
ncbi:hypothetical protein [Filifactor villosus]|uniref:Uncharacterized protein n=1 Tax=Filifactor villosus TaxID=29374 RepID=A0ABV9QLD1_9FIRM